LKSYLLRNSYFFFKSVVDGVCNGLSCSNHERYSTYIAVCFSMSLYCGRSCVIVWIDRLIFKPHRDGQIGRAYQILITVTPNSVNTEVMGEEYLTTYVCLMTTQVRGKQSTSRGVLNSVCRERSVIQRLPGAMALFPFSFNFLALQNYSFEPRHTHRERV